MVVQEQPETDSPGRAACAIMRQAAFERPDDVRGDAEQALALDQRFAYHAELVGFEIGEPAMDELGAGGGGVLGEVVLLEQGDGTSSAGGVPGDAGAIDAAPDDQ